MPRTPAGGRLPHGPRYARRGTPLPALAVPAVIVATLAAAGGCAAPPAAPATSHATGDATAPAITDATAPVTAPRAGVAPGSAPTGRPAPDAAGAAPPAAARTAAPAPDATSPAAAGPSRHRSGPVHRVTGTVVRLSIEGGGTHGTRRTGSIATYVQTPRGREPIDGGLDGVPTGSSVVADVAETPAGTPTRTPTGTPTGTPSTGTTAGAGTVVAARVVTAPPKTPRLAPATHDVTTVLVLPPGARPDGTTSAGLAAAVNGPVAGFWSRQTDGAVRFRVTHAVGWLHVTSRCDDAWGLWAEVAGKVGFTPGPRRHLLVLVPQDVDGCFAGLGTIGATASAGGSAYVRGTLTGLIAHELGHNLGLGHSNGLQCDGASDGAWAGGSWQAGCTTEGYRDWYDVMGVSWERLGTLSTAQAYQLGALRAPDVASVAGPVRATLTAVGEHEGLRSLRVAVGGSTYVVEYRPALGDDAWLRSNWRGLTAGVLVRRDDPAGGSQTLLLDGTPSAAPDLESDWSEPVPAGAALTAAGGRLVVRVEAQTASTADVSVEVDGARAASGVARLGAAAAAPSEGPRHGRARMHLPAR